MTFKELIAVQVLREKLRGEERKLHALHASRNRMASPINDGLPRSITTESLVEKLIVLIAETERTIATLTRQLNEQISITTTLIVQNYPDALAQTILLQRYVFGFEFVDIAQNCGVSKRTVYRVHRKIMDNFS